MKELLPAHAGTRLAAAPVAILRKFGTDRPRGGMEVKRRTARQAATLIAALTVMAAITQGASSAPLSDAAAGSSTGYSPRAQLTASDSTVFDQFGDARRGTLEITTARVGDPGNAPVGIVPFQGPPDQGIYRDCSNAPPGCVLVGGVGYTYQLGEFEITVGQ